MQLISIASVMLAQAASAQQPKFTTPGDVLAAAPAAAWKEIPADDLLVMDLKGGRRVVIQLAPAFAPVHVANIRALARAGYWSGAAVYRVQDNYVAQWGNNESEKPLPAGVVAKPPAEYFRPVRGLAVRPFPYRDSYAPRTGHVAGWPVALDARATTASLTECYGSVGVGRDLSPDTGIGGELYAIIGHAPRHLDRNIAVVGRVVEGIEHLAALPRGTEALGFYKERSSDVPIEGTMLASSLPEADRPRFEMMDTASASFTRWLQVRANRRDTFYIRPAGGVDLCNAPVPVRRKPAR
jgi:peptidylprolyl isomerase